MQRSWVLIGTLACATPAVALEWSGELAAATEWMDRGISQTAGDPAFQASIGLATDPGVYLGLFGSNVDFGDCCSERLQFDGTLGIARPLGALEWDLGVTLSRFPGTSENLDFEEYHLGFRWHNLGFTTFWKPDFANTGREAWYMELGTDYALPWQALRLLLQVGYTHGSALARRFVDDTGLEPYRDWRIGMQRDFGRVTATLAWADTDIGGELRNREPAEFNDGRLFLAVSFDLDAGR
jgi:uncharacterized protein (TIGR02001 family)